MNMRARAIIVQDDQVLLIRRYIDGTVYYVFPGGGFDADLGDMSLNDTVVRECREELGLDVVAEQIVATLEGIVHGQHTHEEFFSCRINGGILGTGTGPEYTDSIEYRGEYTCKWISREDLPSLDVRPTALFRDY